ncbi:MAG: nicotinamide riboside transporter PnuC [Planctomycetota bacterium]
MSALDFAAGAFGAVYCVLTLRFNLWKWPAGAFHCALFGVLFWKFKLYAGVGAAENLGVVFGLICVVLTIRRNIWCWPTGIINVVLFAFMFWGVQLYADLILYFVFFVLNVYGWYEWLRGRKDDGPLVVEAASPHLRALSVVLIAAGTPAAGWTLARFTDASFPYWDSFIMVASLIAQWGLARKYLENWILWICVDLVGVPVYAAKGLRATAVLYAIFLVLATCGLIEWMRAYRRQKAAAA